jgi:hypothetical protein
MSCQLTEWPTSSEASARLARFGSKQKATWLGSLFYSSSSKVPIVLVLIGAATLSIFFQRASSAAIILGILSSITISLSKTEAIAPFSTTFDLGEDNKGTTNVA